MCRLINVLTEHRGKDVSLAVELFLTKGASVDIPIPPYTYENGYCSDDDYDDFLPHPKFKPMHYDRWYYPLSFAVRQYCLPNVIQVLHNYSQRSPKRELIYEEVKHALRDRFSQIYRNEYFIEKAANPKSYFHNVKQLVDKYLEILGFDVSLFNSAEKHKRSEKPRTYRPVPK